MKSIADYIPKRAEAGDQLLQKKLVHAADEYKEKIKDIVNQLVTEYKETIQLEAALPSDSNGMLQTQTPADEQQVELTIISLLF
jgi:hypothetical protein